MFVLLYRWWLTIFDLELDEGLCGFNIGIFVRTREKTLEKDVGGRDLLDGRSTGRNDNLFKGIREMIGFDPRSIKWFLGLNYMDVLRKSDPSLETNRRFVSYIHRNFQVKTVARSELKWQKKRGLKHGFCIVMEKGKKKYTKEKFQRNANVCFVCRNVVLKV